jgi:hypothetical protein
VLRREDLKHLAFVIYRTPEIMRLSINPDEHLVQVPAPLRKRPMIKASFPSRGRKYRTETVPPVPNRLVTNVDASLEQNILDLSQRQRIADITLGFGDWQLMVAQRRTYQHQTLH